MKKKSIKTVTTEQLKRPPEIRHDLTHPIIWLQPWCDGCEKHCNSGEGRMWCQDDAWGKCEECDRASVKYVIASLSATTDASTKGEK